MILVMTLLMVLIVAGSTAGALAHQLFNGFPLSGYVTVIIGIALSLVAGFLLFASIYAAFSNVKMRFLGPELTETVPQHRVLGGTNQKTRRAT